MFGKHKFLLRESRRKSWLSSCDLEFSPLNKFILGGNTTLYSFCQTNMYSEEFFLGLYSIYVARSSNVQKFNPNKGTVSQDFWP